MCLCQTKFRLRKNKYNPYLIYIWQIHRYKTLLWMPTCCFHGNCINIFLQHKVIFILYIPLFPFFPHCQGKAQLFPRKKTINGFLNQWLSSYVIELGRILALGKGWVHITMSNFGERWEWTLEIHRRLTQVITYNSYFCFPWVHCTMEASFFQQSLGGHKRNSFANFLTWYNLCRMARKRLLILNSNKGSIERITLAPFTLFSCIWGNFKCSSSKW